MHPALENVPFFPFEGRQRTGADDFQGRRHGADSEGGVPQQASAATIVLVHCCP